jgi:GNAT superfamily N-acetyltransferase
MEIRSARPEDALAVARVHVSSWQKGYRGLLPDAYLDSLQPEERAPRYDFANTDPHAFQTIVGVEDGEVIGFATTCPARDPELAGLGELAAFYVDPRAWGRGVGQALMAASRVRLSNLGFQRACLWLLDGNVRADRFYRRDGWAPDGHKRTDTVWAITVNEARYQTNL